MHRTKNTPTCLQAIEQAKIKMRRKKGFLTGMTGAKQKLLDGVAFLTNWCIFTKVLLLTNRGDFAFIITLVSITTFFYVTSTNNNTCEYNHTRISVIAFCSYLFGTSLHYADRVRWTWIVPTTIWFTFKYTAYYILFLPTFTLLDAKRVHWTWIMPTIVLVSNVLVFICTCL